MEKKQRKNDGFDKQTDLSRKNREKTLTRREIEEALGEEYLDAEELEYLDDEDY